MANLTKSTGTVTLSGAVEKVTFPAVYGWVWVKNMSDADMFLGLDDGISAGADGVLSIPAGECGRIQTDGQDSVYLMGSGNALVVAQNYADCPFKVGGKGGETPDLSLYALKSKYGDTTIDVGRKAGTTVGINSTAEGYNTTASGSCSHAEGFGTIASGNGSHAGGLFTKALHDNEAAFGYYNESNDNTLFSVGDGTADDARHNAFEITTTGGKLHDKDIATTDLIPAELPANGGNADTVGNLKITVDTITANSDASGYVWLGNKKFISVLAQGYGYSGIYIDAASGSTNLYFPNNRSTTMTIRVVYLEEV